MKGSKLYSLSQCILLISVCECDNNVILSSDCLSEGIFPEYMGEYQFLCQSENGKKFYSHNSDQVNSYIYYEENLNQWLVSNQIGDPIAALGINSLQNCLLDNELTNSVYYAFDGQVQNCLKHSRYL